MALAGFGSLSGEIEIFDLIDFKSIGSCTSPSSSLLKWSDDSRFFMTAIIASKLQVHHRISIFTYNGVLIDTIKFEVNDLINVNFFFSGLSTIEEKEIEVNNIAKPASHTLMK